MDEAKDRSENQSPSKTYRAIVQRGSLPADGLKQAGQTLHSACRPIISVDAWRALATSRTGAILGTGVVIGCVSLLLRLFSSSHLIGIPLSLVLLFGSGYLSKDYVEYYRSKHSPKMVNQLDSMGESEEIFIHADEGQNVIKAYRQLDAPLQFEPVPTDSTTVALTEHRETDSTMQIAEYAVEARPRSDRLLTQADDCPATTESVNLPIDLIRTDLQASDLDIVVQVLIRGRDSDRDTLRNKESNIQHDNDYGIFKANFNRAISLAISPASESDESTAGTAQSLSKSKQEKLEACNRTDADSTFGVMVRALAVVPATCPPASATRTFNRIEQRLEKATTNEISIGHTIYSEGETGIFRRDFETVFDQFIAREQRGVRAWLRTKFPIYTTAPELICDSQTIWNYCLPSTQTITRSQQESKPRDQNPTERPPQSALDELTRETEPNSSTDTQHRDNHD